jgi:transposase-like protein
MSRRPRRNHSPAFKAKVAIAALGDDKTMADIAHKHDVHPNQVTDWRRQLLERAATVFGAAAEPAQPVVDLNALHAKIGQLTLENDFLEGALNAAQAAPTVRKAGLLSAKR